MKDKCNCSYSKNREQRTKYLLFHYKRISGHIHQDCWCNSPAISGKDHYTKLNCGRTPEKKKVNKLNGKELTASIRLFHLHKRLYLKPCLHPEVLLAGKSGCSLQCETNHLIRTGFSQKTSPVLSLKHLTTS